MCWADNDLQYESCLDADCALTPAAGLFLLLCTDVVGVDEGAATRAAGGYLSSFDLTQFTQQGVGLQAAHC